jgi:ribosomal protein L7/L12
MRETEQYRELAEYLHKISTDFMNSFPWVKELTPDQKAVHKVSQQVNVDCHNGYLSNIFLKMANAKTFRLQHRDYHRVSNDIGDDSTNKKEDKDVPVGVILRRLSTSSPRRNEHRPAGMLSNEVRGTLYYKGTGDKRLVSTCKVSTGEYSFYHPWFWDVPSVEDILKVFSFSEEKHIQKLALIQSTAGTVMSEPESATKIETKKEEEKFDLLFVNYQENGKIPLIKAIREATGLGLLEAKEICETTGRIIKSFDTIEEARECQSKYFTDKATTMICSPEKVNPTPQEPTMTLELSSTLGEGYPSWVNQLANPSIMGLRALEDKE